MDNGKGRFEQFETEEALRNKLADLRERFPKLNENAFRVGEEVEIQGSKFKVTKITPKKLVLRILPR